MTLPSVSIVIPVYNGERTLPECLTSLAKLNYPEELLEIIMVDDGTIDRTVQIIEEFGYSVVKVDHAGPSTARNVGIAHASGDYIAFTDADCILHPDWITTLLTGFENGVQVAGVGGSQRAVQHDPVFSKRIQQLLELLDFLGGYTKGYEQLTPVDHNPSCNVLYRKQCLLQVGGFLPGLFPGEDVELDYRLRRQGYQILYQPTSIVYHHRPRTYGQFFRMIFGYGKGSGGFLLRRYGVTRSFQLFFPLFFILFLADISLMLNNLLLFFIFHSLLFITLAGVIFSKVRQIGGTMQLILLFLITLVAWNLGFIRGLFWGKPAQNTSDLIPLTDKRDSSV